MKCLMIFISIALTSTLVYAQKFTMLAMNAVNSSYDEQNPVLSRDGMTLWFTVANHPQNAGGRKDLGDIWFSTWDGTKWSVPNHGGNAINDRGYNAVAGISEDGNTLTLFNHYGTPGSPARTQGISISRRTGNSWSPPEKVAIPYFVNQSETISGQLSADGTVLVYSAEAFDSRGAEDLYVSLRDGSGHWSEPRNMGSVLNSSFQELSPSVSLDKRYLYFSSNGRKGYGSSDVYFSERLDDTWTNWSRPANIGSRVNSEGRELYYHTYPAFHVGLFTSTQNSDGYGDIRSFIDTVKNMVADTMVKIVEIKRENTTGKNEKISTVKGVVADSKTGLPLQAKLTFSSDSTYRTTSSRQGQYSLRISSVSVYNIVVEAPGYVGVLEKLDIHTFEMQLVELNFKLQPVEVGATVNLKNVLFQVGTTNMLKDSYAELNVVVDLLKANPQVEIELSGHTDNRGDARLNLQLSQKRVESVKAYLVAKGVKANRIKGKGYGGQKPIANSDTEESRRMNRRVEFTIIKD